MTRNKPITIKQATNGYIVTAAPDPSRPPHTELDEGTLVFNQTQDLTRFIENHFDPHGIFPVTRRMPGEEAKQ
jgi:hypothetical protein